MDNVIKQKIEFEISQIEEHIAHSSVLIQKCRLQAPDYVELCAAGSIIHSYYNGIENILLLIAKNIDDVTPNSGKWHSELLFSMCAENENRTAVFSETLKISLTEYMNFRHFFRHSYGYSMKWEKFSHLFLGLEDNWMKVKTELNGFLSKNS